MKTTTSFLILSILGLSVTAQATVTVVDDFESLPLGALTSGAGGWTVDATLHNNRSIDIVSGGLSYNQNGFTLNGGSQHLRFTLPQTGQAEATTDLISKTFAPQTGGVDSTVYFAYTVGLGTDPDQFVNLGMSGASYSRTSSAASVLRGGDQFRVWDSASSSGTAVDTSANANDPANGTYLYIGKIEFNGSGNETVSLMINPTSTTEPVGSWTYEINSREMGVTSIGYFGVFANNGDNRVISIDNILVADTWNEIVTAVPEPSTYALLLGFGALAMVMIRRRLRA